MFSEDTIRYLTYFYDYSEDHAASCSDIAKKYNNAGEYYNTYNVAVCTAGKKVLKKMGLPEIHGVDSNYSFWSVLMLGRHRSLNMNSGFIWKLRPELAEAIKELYYNKSENNIEKNNAFPLWVRV